LAFCVDGGLLNSQLTLKRVVKLAADAKASNEMEQTKLDLYLQEMDFLLDLHREDSSPARLEDFASLPLLYNEQVMIALVENDFVRTRLG
jgi:hypothetical protein